MEIGAPAAQRDLTSLLDLERLDATTWLGPADPVDLPQLFGGQLVSQSIVAGGRSTGPAMRVHSSHTTFLRAGTAGQPVRYAVEPLSGGRQRSACDVSAWQDDRLLARTLVSAATDAGDGGHARPAPDGGRVEDAVPLSVVAEESGGLGPWWSQFDAVEVRIVVDAPEAGTHSAAAPTLLWMRTTEPLPDDPLVHRAALAYASDLLLMSTAAAVHGVPVGHESALAAQWWGISMDHTMWFHDRVRADEWLLHEQVTPMARAGRALVQSAVSDVAGRPVCQLAQEALLRRQR